MINNEINDFIHEVFNYYNGKINVINSNAILDINWCNLTGSSAGGYSMLPNMVIINPLVIMRYCDNLYNIKISIIETIIHELYHTDQIINYSLYMADINYNNFIERSCELETAIYIAGHEQEIHDQFGIWLHIDSNSYEKIINYWWYPGVRYQRRYFHDHIFMCINNLTNFNKEIGNSLYELITDTIEDSKSITLNINEDIIPAYINGVPVSIEEFNKRFIKYYCGGTYLVRSFKPTYDDYDNVIFYMDLELKNIMCKKV